ncbi:hypothetical protein STCU_07241 [Strigomonas culicis]|uniref:Uncharacterized protein n=1 Tax=Strigomonas culicis TaxID=28005 RepID=S9VBB0_9TRYP|nr:hypothetical protein STCU_07241 [Strigomonas culicis]|eukprot:EPY24316.1 hypothetical protein STCU_07241 [Strigomonas culicis]
MTAVPTDEEGVLLTRLKHAFHTYDGAIKKYLTAVRELEGTMELLAISVRELSQSESNSAVKAVCDTFCDAIDEHKSSRVLEAGSKAKERAGSAGAAPAEEVTDPKQYFFSIYMSDFAREITGAIDQLKEEVRAVEKSKESRDKRAAKYHKTKRDVDELETKLAKKNQGIADNVKHKEKSGKRDMEKESADAEDLKFRQDYQRLLQTRSQVLMRLVRGIGTYSGRYYTGVANMMERSGSSGGQ